MSPPIHAETFDRLWDAALDWPAYLETLKEKQDIWHAHDRRADVHDDEAARLADLPADRRVLILTEDWCGDAARSVPVLARALGDAPRVQVRFLPSDDHPEVIEEYLTHGGRAIPMAVVVDEHGAELGTWGPRPAPLQALMRKQRREQGPPTGDAVNVFYQPIMAWYGQDKGRTTLQEVLMLLERGGEPR